MEKVLEFDRPKPLMSDGRVMQTPNDRPPLQAGELAPPDPPAAWRSGSGRTAATSEARWPAAGPAGDPLAKQGPTGGDLNVAPRDELDDLIADAMDGATTFNAAGGVSGGTNDLATAVPPGGGRGVGRGN